MMLLAVCSDDRIYLRGTFNFLVKEQLSDRMSLKMTI